MPETWPVDLPQKFLRDGFQNDLPNNVISSQPDRGAPKRRRVTTTNIEPLSGRMRMTTEQWYSLKTFYQETILETLPFDFPDPDDENETIEVCFSRPPSRAPSNSPGRWIVTLSLEKQP